MSTNNEQADASEKINSAVSKLKEAQLLDFDDENKVSTGRDINVKITALDSDMAQLRVELSSINSSVEEGLDRLGDTDTDLTAKVSETYKRLGEIDNAYKSLLQISSRIDGDLQQLNGSISDVAVQSATGIKTLEQSTVTQTHELAQKNHQVASKVSQLVETSKLTNEMMDKSIQSATEKMLLIEKNVVAQIETLSVVTKDKTDSISDSVEHSKAKILKLQSVDEAIIRRATTLEITAAELTAKGQYIDSSVEQLQISSDALLAGVSELRERAVALEETAKRHSSIIDGLQKGGADLAARLKTLAGREQKHFNVSLIGLLLLLLVSFAIFITQQNRFDASEIKIAAQGETFDRQITGVQQSQAGADAMATQSLAALEEKIEQVAYQLNDVQDQTESIAGRIDQSVLIDKIGDDNIIHGPQWITALSPQGFTVQLAYADSKKVLYEIAQDSNFYLQDSLSYFVANEDGVEKYVLLSGNYANRQLAELAVKSLPSYIDQQQPVVREISVVQQYIAAL